MINPCLYQIDELLPALADVQNILLIGHVSPDGDTLGSMSALRFRLERMGKSVQIAVDGIVGETLSFLPDIDRAITKPEQVKPFDAVISVDVSSIDRLGAFQPVFENSPRHYVVDHHESNPGFGQINVIDGDAPACGVVIHRLFQRTGLPLTLEESICLYTAISTDTGCFIYDSTSPEAFRIIADLLEAGLPLAKTARTLFKDQSLAFIRLLGIALNKQTFLAENRISCMRLTKSDMAAAGANDSHREGIIKYGIDIRCVKLAYIASEESENRTKFSLRSKEDSLDVGKMATRLGGGGHIQAAGVTLNLPMAEATALMEKELLALLAANE